MFFVVEVILTIEAITMSPHYMDDSQKMSKFMLLSFIF